MKVRAIRDSYKDCPKAILDHVGFPESVLHISIGTVYEVHALAVFDGMVFLLILEDGQRDFPHWNPAWLFEVCDWSVPDDWICNIISGGLEGLQMVLGPEFIAKDEESYCRMAELEKESVDAFWKRIEARRKTE